MRRFAQVVGYDAAGAADAEALYYRLDLKLEQTYAESIIIVFMYYYYRFCDRKPATEEAKTAIAPYPTQHSKPTLFLNSVSV